MQWQTLLLSVALVQVVLNDTMNAGLECEVSQRTVQMPE